MLDQHSIFIKGVQICVHLVSCVIPELSPSEYTSTQNTVKVKLCCPSAFCPVNDNADDDDNNDKGDLYGTYHKRDTLHKLFVCTKANDVTETRGKGCKSTLIGNTS